MKDSVRVATADSNRLLRVLGDDGTELAASFRVERVGDATTIVFESRGGTRGSVNERNSDYAQGLELVLARLKTKGFRIREVLVESRHTASIPPVDRRLPLDTLSRSLIRHN